MIAYLGQHKFCGPMHYTYLHKTIRITINNNIWAYQTVRGSLIRIRVSLSSLIPFVSGVLWWSVMIWVASLRRHVRMFHLLPLSLTKTGNKTHRYEIPPWLTVTGTVIKEATVQQLEHFRWNTRAGFRRTIECDFLLLPRSSVQWVSFSIHRNNAEET